MEKCVVCGGDVIYKKVTNVHNGQVSSFPWCENAEKWVWSCTLIGGCNAEFHTNITPYQNIKIICPNCGNGT